MTDFTTQLSEFQAMYRRIFAMLEDYPESLRERSGACGVWSPKQIAAHFSGWLVDAAEQFTHPPEDVRHPNDYKAAEIHAYNAKSVEARAHLDWDATITDLQTCYTTFLDNLAQVPDDAKQSQDAYGAWLDVLNEDCAEHYEDFQKFKEEQTP